MSDLPTELRDYLSRYTYIEYESKSWMDRLLYAMPVNRINKYEEVVTHATELDEDSVLILA